MFLRYVRVVPVIIPHINNNEYSGCGSSCEMTNAPTFVSILILVMLILAGILAIITIFKIK